MAYVCVQPPIVPPRHTRFATAAPIRVLFFASLACRSPNSHPLDFTLPPFDFSTAPDRTGSDSIKWRRYAGLDVIPMWVADMDFAAPPAVLDALHARIDHGVFGYADPWPSVLEAVVEGIARDLSLIHI